MFEKLANKNHYELKDLDGIILVTVKKPDRSLVKERLASYPAVLEPNINVIKITPTMKEIVLVSFILIPLRGIYKRQIH